MNMCIKIKLKLFFLLSILMSMAFSNLAQAFSLGGIGDAFNTVTDTVSDAVDQVSEAVPKELPKEVAGGAINPALIDVSKIDVTKLNPQLLLTYESIKLAYEKMPKEVKNSIPAELRDPTAMSEFLKKATPAEIRKYIPNEFWTLAPYLAIGGALYGFFKDSFSFGGAGSGEKPLIQFSNAELTSGNIVPFGGKSTGVNFCTCTFNLLITLDDYVTKKPLQIIYQPFFTRLNREYSIAYPGVYLVGNYYAGASAGCKILVGVACIDLGTPSGVITNYPNAGVGTSFPEPGVKEVTAESAN